MKNIKRKTDWDPFVNFILFVVGCTFITVMAMQLAFYSRGYFAIGGEVLIIPLVFVVRYIVKDFKEIAK